MTEKGRVLRVLTGVVIAALLGGAASPARAQHRWVVLSAATGEDEFARARDAAEHARAALTTQGETVLARERASARLDADLSRPFEPMPDGLDARIATTAESVLEDVAFGRLQRAFDAGEPLLDDLEARAEAWGRTDAARDVANLCLYLARADLASERPGRATERVDRCVRLVPAIEADERLHPPAVRELVRERRRAYDALEAGGVLSIQTTATDPEGCVVRVNGSMVGRTPWVRVAVPAGRYGVQVECEPGVPGRIVPAVVETGAPTRVTVAAALARSLDTTSGSISLRYRDAEELAAALASHVGTLARLLEVDRAIVARVLSGVVTLEVFEIGGGDVARLVGTADVSLPVDDASSRVAIDAARAGRSPPTGAAPLAPGPSGTDVGIAVLGGSFLTVGVAALGIGWFFWSELEARGRELDRASSARTLQDAQVAFDEARTPILILGASGGALAGAGAALLVTTSGEYDVPWWSWVVGATGLAVAGTGIYLMTTAGDCHGNAAVGEPCARRTPTWLLGTLVLEHAAPFLAVPITHWIRAAIGPGARVTASVHVGERVELSIAGTF